MPNRIYLGPNDRQPKTVTDKQVIGALLPGTFVLERDTGLMPAATFSNLLRLLGEKEFYGDTPFDGTSPLKVPYNDRDIGIAYILEPGQRYQAVVAAGAYSYGGALSVAASGRLAPSSGGQVVVAYYKGQAGTIAAGETVEIEIANFHNNVS